jgi:hypothetical protein
MALDTLYEILFGPIDDWIDFLEASPALCEYPVIRDRARLQLTAF